MQLKRDGHEHAPEDGDGKAFEVERRFLRLPIGADVADEPERRVGDGRGAEDGDADDVQLHQLDAVTSERDRSDDDRQHAEEPDVLPGARRRQAETLQGGRRPDAEHDEQRGGETQQHEQQEAGVQHRHQLQAPLVDGTANTQHCGSQWEARKYQYDTRTRDVPNTDTAQGQAQPIIYSATVSVTVTHPPSQDQVKYGKHCH